MRRPALAFVLQVAVRVWLLTIVAVIAAWAYLIFGSVLAPVPVLLVGLGVWLGLRRRWAPLAVLVGISPIGFSVAWAIGSYLIGTARLWSVGYPTVELANVGPMTRLQTASSGCMVAGGEWMVNLPNNIVLAALTFVLGPMRRTYDGPYPTADELEAALASATSVPIPDVAAGRVFIAGRRVQLPPGLGGRLAAAISRREGMAPPTAIASVWRNRVLAFRFSFPQSADKRPLDALVDPKSGRLFAYHGARLDTGLPKQWPE